MGYRPPPSPLAPPPPPPDGLDQTEQCLVEALGRQAWLNGRPLAPRDVQAVVPDLSRQGAAAALLWLHRHAPARFRALCGGPQMVELQPLPEVGL